MINENRVNSKCLFIRNAKVKNKNRWILLLLIRVNMKLTGVTQRVDLPRHISILNKKVKLLLLISLMIFSLKYVFVLNKSSEISHLDLWTYFESFYLISTSLILLFSDVELILFLLCIYLIYSLELNFCLLVLLSLIFLSL